MDIVLGLIAGAILCCCVLLSFGCICHLFKRHGFSSFEDEVESGNGVSMYPANESATDSVMFEPLPDILAKTVGSRALRPRITCSEEQRQTTAAKLITVYKPFPRSHLFYVKEIGLGWFGQVLQGEADRLSPEGHRAKVVVKILKDDASPTDKKLFLEEVNPYREIEHVNILKLLGQCTETLPFLVIMEFPPLGDLKSYLLSQGKGPYIKFAIDAATGLACLHKNGFVHHDFAARNCLLMSDLTLKIGDYGIGEDLFREDYYDTGCDLLPIRWMSPESLDVKNGVWQLSSFTPQSNVWSLSVMLWELLAHGRKPYCNMKDEDVLQRVVNSGHVKLPPPSTDIPLHDRWFEVMEMCWQEADDRPTAEDMMAFLQQIDEESVTQTNSPVHSVHRQRSIDSDKFVPNGPSTPTHGFSTTILSPKVGKHSTKHVAEVLVHRVDDTDFVARNDGASGFEDDFSKINIRKNTIGEGFEDNFVHCDNKTGSDDEISQNDTSILAFGGNASEVSDSEVPDKVKHISTDPNMNVLTEPVPVIMSTPSKQNGSEQLNLPSTKTRQSDLFKTALDNQGSQCSSAQYLTAMDMNTYNSGATKSWTESETSGKHLNENQNDEGYRTDTNRTPDIIVSSNLTDLHEHEDNNEPSLDVNKLSVNDSGRTTDPETEKAKEIYISKGATLPPSSLHKSRSLGTIPEDGIPSDDVSQTEVVFEEPTSGEIGQGFEGFEWDDYIGEELVGRVRYTSDESPRPTEEFTEWTFDQESGSEASNSKPGSIASESDGEVTRSTPTSIDTRAYIANLLSNRLNSLAQQTSRNQYSNSSSFYSFSQYDDAFEHAYSDTESPPFSPMSPIAENPNAIEILKHEIDLENASAALSLNNQNYDHNDLLHKTSLSMLSNTNSDNFETQNTDVVHDINHYATHDIEPKPGKTTTEPIADDNKPTADVRSLDSLQLEEEFVWVDNHERHGQDDQLMKDASNKSSTSSDPGVLDSPNVVVVEPSDRMLIDTNEAVVYIAASVIDTECTCIK